MEEGQKFNGRLIVRYPEKNLPERIRKYLMGIYEYLDSMVDTETNLFKGYLGNEFTIFGRYEIDRNLQVYCLLLKLAEVFLSTKAHDPSSVGSYFRRTLENPKHKAAFEKLKAGDKKWAEELSDKYDPHADLDELKTILNTDSNEEPQVYFPYFVIYCHDNGLKPLDALSGICRKIPFPIHVIQAIEESDDYSPEKFSCSSISRYFSWYQKKVIEGRELLRKPINAPAGIESGYYSILITKEGREKEYPRTCDTYKFVIDGPQVPFNSKLLEINTEEKKLVFVTEFIHSARFLERQIIENHFDYLKRQILNIAGKKDGFVAHGLKWAFSERTEYSNLSPNYEMPAGDCIWIAPVGGY